MISRLQGSIQGKDAASVTVMTGGVGFEVFIPLSTYYQLPEDGETVALHIKTVVRDDAIELFGFLSREEKEAFLLLTSVSRIGPRLAVSVLSGISPAELVEAINTKNAARLSSVPGVGIKTAERLILELKDKTARLAELVPPGRPLVEERPLDDVGRDIVSALQNLGYTKAQAEKAMSEVRSEAPEEDRDLSNLLRLSLKRLQKA